MATARSHFPVHSELPSALAAQAAGVAISALAGYALAPVSPLFMALAQAVAAASIARLLRQPAWWLILHLSFAPAIIAALALHLDPLWYLGAFVLLALTYGGVHRSRVPLYFSGAAATNVLLGLLPPKARFLDLGCGIGSVLNRVGRSGIVAQSDGVEAALLPWLIARLRARGRYRVRREDLWHTDLGRYDVVYAYLSPAAMPALWTKAIREMNPGSLLISNSFPVPQKRADEVRAWGAGAADVLYVYKLLPPVVGEIPTRASVKFRTN